MTLADALAAHDEALTFGGRGGVASLHLIESAIGRPYSGYHRHISEKTAALLHSMVANRGFVDGNKRTAWLQVEVLMARSGYVLDMPDEEPIDDFVVAVATGELGFDAIVVYFREKTFRERPDLKQGGP